MPKVAVEILADPSQAVKGFETFAGVAAASYKEVSAAAEKSALAQVHAAEKGTAALRAQITALKTLSTDASLSAEQQKLAAAAAERTQIRLNRAMGITAASTRGLGRESQTTERELSRATRGALAGSGVFSSFGRSLAFASGGFIAFQSGTEFLRASIDAARQAAVAQRSLAAQMKASGESFTANQDRIDKVALSYARFGFTSEDVVRSLTVLERGTGSINKALQLQAGVADLARAKNIDLADAANIVAKVFGGQETALRRAVPGLEKNAHGLDLIREAFGRLRGQAAANTTESERFQATLHDTEVTIGKALLPTMNRYLGALDKWLSKTSTQTKIQHAANVTAKEGATAFNLLAAAIGKASFALDKYQELLKKTGQRTDFWGTILRFGETQVPGLQKTVDALNALRAAMSKPAPGPGSVWNAIFDPGDVIGRFIVGARAGAGGGGGGGTRRPRPTSLQGRFNLDELRLAQAQVAGNVAAQRSILLDEAKILRSLAAQAKTLKDRTAITQQLAAVEDQIRSIDQSALDAANQAKSKAAAAAKKAAEAARKAAEAAKQFSVPLALQVDQARLQALGKPTTDILRKIRAAAEKALKSGRLGLQGQLDAWNTIADVNQQLADNITSMLGGFRQASTRALTANLNLTNAQRKALRERLSQLGPHGTIPGVGVGAAGYRIDAAGRPIVIHNNLYVDGKQVASSTTKHQQTHRRRNPSQTRGPNAGVPSA